MLEDFGEMTEALLVGEGDETPAMLCKSEAAAAAEGGIGWGQKYGRTPILAVDFELWLTTIDIDW